MTLMTSRLGGAVFLFALAACAQPAPSTARAANQCDGLRAERTIALTGDNARDTIETTALGQDCERSVLIWTLRNEAGDPLKVFAAPFADLALPQEAATPGGVQMALERWASAVIDNTSASPEWPLEAPYLPDEAGGGATTAFLRETYEAIRAAKLRRLCVPTGSERFSCLFYDPDSKVVDVHFSGGGI